MPMQEMSLSELSTLTKNSVAVKKALANAEIPDANDSPALKVAGVSGEASLSKPTLRSVDKGEQQWVQVQVLGIVQTPSEYRGKFVNPQYMFDAKAMGDSEEAANAVSGMLAFLDRLGIPHDRIESVKTSANFFPDAIKLIDASKGTSFKYSVRQNKKNPEYVVYYANGAVQAAPGDKSPAASQASDAPAGGPQVGEKWRDLRDGVVKLVEAVDVDNETVDLVPLDGGPVEHGVSFFDENDNPQIEHAPEA